ncbi:FkbM family methyltransferase [Thioclava pacifica]|uniref:Methyltransferase FkbM domain-containing protein n=1 Tax=Thioclava pacifica DSM 10166 TaxID=1353537 RepID=A0A074JXY4_9RHOB|nr:FkbM family methyltransferase [Thioclava pacifica]KEO54187.1 hypothetical protein TP2_04500 [Thioclava pacifica DSM 10166]
MPFKFRKFRRRLFFLIQRLRGKSCEDFAPHGVPVHVPSNADIAIRYLLAKGLPYEEPEAEMVRQYLQPGTNVIELGGCVGVISALVRDRIGPDAQHIIVEAKPELAAICRQNAERGAAPGAVEVVEAAVDYSGKPMITFALGHNAHVGHVARDGEGGFSVPAITLSNLAERLPDGPFALVCDIEGEELALFAAEGALLERATLVILETHPHVYPGKEADLARMRQQIEMTGLQQVAESDQVICFRRPV